MESGPLKKDGASQRNITKQQKKHSNLGKFVANKIVYHISQLAHSEIISPQYQALVIDNICCHIQLLQEHDFITLHRSRY